MFDGKLGYVGSDNHDNRGQEYSTESIAVFNDPKTLEHLQLEHELDIKDSELVTIELCNKILSGISTKGKVLGTVLKKWF